MGDTIRVLQMIGSLNIGGSQAMIINLYNNIDRNKIQFDFILDHPQEAYYKDLVVSLGAKIYQMPAFNGKNFLKVRSAWDAFFTEHSEYKILHSHVRSYASIYLPIAKKHGVKTIIHSHATSNGKGVSSIVKKLLQYPLRYQADCLMSCSNEAGKWLYGKRACATSKYVFLPNAIDTKKYRFSHETSEKYRKELGVDGKFVIGHVGRFHEAKNHMFLLDVFAEVCSIRPDAVLLLVGDGQQREKIEQKIKKLGLKNRVILTGNRSDVSQLMQAMDIFVFPSLWEGLPVTLIEAQASGMPCLISDSITSDVDVTELIKRLPNNNLNIWVDAILNANLSRYEVIQQVKRSGFDVESSVDRLMSVYNNI